MNMAMDEMGLINETRAGRLNVRVYETRLMMGADAARLVTGKITDLLAAESEINMIFAAAPSQEEFLAGLRAEKSLDWTRVNAFHMDEYLGLPATAPQGFGNFLKERLFDQLPFKSVHCMDGNASDPVAECTRYEALLKEFPPHIVCMGIGENGHIAFNDPHVADFQDEKWVKTVDLDHACRQQQVNDGCFSSLGDVPRHALTLTVPALMAAGTAFCMVPGANKATAVFNTLQQPVSEPFPATILREHPDATLFLDRDSAGSLFSKV